jgi:hypothetical protein
MSSRYLDVDADGNSGAGRNNADSVGMSNTEVEAGIAWNFRLSMGAITETQLACGYATELSEYLTQLVTACNETPLVLAPDEAASPCPFVLCQPVEPSRRLDIIDFKIKRPNRYLRRGA